MPNSVFMNRKSENEPSTIIKYLTVLLVTNCIPIWHLSVKYQRNNIIMITSTKMPLAQTLPLRNLISVK